MKVFIIAITLILLLAGCKKANERSCFKGSGDATTKRVDLSEFSFKGFNIYDNININLIPDSVNYAEISSFENRINFINFR